MDLPAFTCTGQIISSQTMTAAACWRYDCKNLPVIRIPDGADFTTDILPDKVMSIVNRDHQEYEEELPVVWDKITFPTEHKRTLVTGEFADGYAQYEDYMPQCLVVWESDTTPFFLNVYLESATQRYDMVVNRLGRESYIFSPLTMAKTGQILQARMVVLLRKRTSRRQNLQKQTVNS